MVNIPPTEIANRTARAEAIRMPKLSELQTSGEAPI